MLLFLEINQSFTTVRIPGSPRTPINIEQMNVSSTALSDGKWL